MPLVQLATGQLLKQLRSAGVELEVTPEEANQLTLLRPLLKIVDPDSAEATVDNGLAEKRNVGDMITKVDTAQSQDGSVATLEDSASQGSEAEAEVDFEGLDEKLVKRLKRKTRADRDAAILRGKFVDVVDILPPLPKKGDFQVENIKASPYFFS